MDDLAESLWAAFAAESEEHLTAAEPLIAAAESETPSADDIAQLFRDFHSLKGLARGLDMKALESVAHHAESLLGLVRNGTQSLTMESVGVLLEAIDVMRALRRLAVEERRDGEPPAALLTRLQALAAAAPTGGAVGQPAAAPVAEQSPWVDADPEMCRYFAELLRDDLGELGQRLPLVATADAGASDPANIGRMQDILGELEHAAGAIDQHVFATLCRGLANVLQPGMEWSVFHLLTRFDDFLATFEGETGLDAGGGTFRADMRDVLMRFAAVGRERMLTGLRKLADEPSMFGTAQPECFGAVAESAGDLARALAMFPDLAATARPAFLLQDIFARCRLGEFTPSERTIAAALALAEAMGDGPAPAPEPTNRFLAEALADMDTSGHHGCAAEFVKAFLRKHRVAEDLLASLSPEACGEAAELLAKGWDHPFVIEARLESSPELRERFLRWLETDVRPVTNKVLRQNGETLYRFLLLTRGDVDQVKARLGDIDGGSRRLVRLVEVAPPEGKPGAPGPETGTAIRVPSAIIDRFMAHIGELLQARSSIHVTLSERGIGAALGRLHKAASGLTGAAAEEMTRALRHIEECLDELARGDQNLNGVLKRLQESALELRVVPIDTVFSRFPRVVRDIAQRTGKSVRLELAGREVRIDKGMVEQLVDPLTHMVRNAIDHGIETTEARIAAGKPATGTIRLSASQRGNRVIIDIADDGKGLDRARILAKAAALGLVPDDAAAMSDEDVFGLIFTPGFSTNDIVTETSGRGVGMDVVNVNVSRVGGRVAIRSAPGQGTTFTLSLPLSAAIQDVLLVESAGQVFAIPERFLLEICEVEASSFETVRGQRAMMLRQSYLPLFGLGVLLGLPVHGGQDARARTVLVIGSGAARMGLEVDRIARRQELYVKDVHARLLTIPGIGGASVLGDGRAVIILDVEGLFRLAAAGGNHSSAALAAE